ncbi:ISAs1 family transposase [Aetokthonos hydrillicola Thurmond2011]|uniref:ISAs1 family transposase n=1 Tax=Aetokthonos hydrillicola Thurmond2011 TaxID=2712845 RepID=A0AAP5IGI4_9CYAN|nr:ISAs1 family transposase [Aetokthonos hydrillicola Thurmond2011]
MRERGGNYVFTVKDNQRKLKRETDRCLDLLADTQRYQQHQTTDTGHGRVETRYIRMVPSPDKLKKAWPGLQAIGTVQRTRQNRKTGNTSVHTVHFITSLNHPAPDILALNRGHWGIENKLHRHKDTLLDEDRSTIRKQAAPHNMAVIRASSVAFLRSNNTPLTHASQNFARNPSALFSLIF